MAIAPKTLAKQLMGILQNDEDRLQKIDDYANGLQDDPYLPPNATDEYKLLASRSVSNWMPLLVDTPAQALYVDSFRSGKKDEADAKVVVDPASGPSKRPNDGPEWDHWQKSRLDARQTAVHRGALKFGHSFTLTEKLRSGEIRTKGLSAMRTAALYEDPANDDTPYAALTVVRWPNGDTAGKARMWDAKTEYIVTFKTGYDVKTVVVGKKHGASECPVTRFAAAVDLEGRTCGVIEPMIPLQNRINQTVFDLLIVQTFASFKVRWVTGMNPPVERDEDGEPVLDTKGNQKPLPIDHNASRFLFADDETTKFGTLDETPLTGFIESIDMSIRHLAAISQTPPHHLLGQIANLSAEALQAAETALSRKIEEFRKGFGESWERVFRLAAEMAGDTGAAEDFSGEVIWRDMEQRSLAQAADALGKLKEQLGIPGRGLWDRVPNVTKQELDYWDDLLESDPETALANALKSSTPTRSKVPVDDSSFATG